MKKNALKKLFISHKWDLILGAALLLIALCLFLVFGKTQKDGAYVQVKQNWFIRRKLIEKGKVPSHDTFMRVFQYLEYTDVPSHHKNAWT